MTNEKSHDSPTGLYWKGKRTEVERIVLPFQTVEIINESRATREKDKETPLFKRSRSTDTHPDTWYNRLIWGDNKYIMASLLEEFAGKVDLIYIDPPFATGADFSVKIEVGDVEWTKEPSAIEEKAYRDTWGKGLDSYLQMMYERLILMRDLLSDKGSIYVHCDYRVNSGIRFILDEIFGGDNFRNEIVSRRAQTKSLLKQFDKIRTLNVFHDTIFWYSKDHNTRFNAPKKTATDNQQKESWQSMWNNADRPTMRYDLLGCIISSGQWKWSKERAYIAVENYKEYEEFQKDKFTLEEYWVETGCCKEFIRRQGESKPQYWIPPRNEVIADTNWFDISGYSYSTGYDTEKSEPLLERIIKASSNPDDLVADFFCGSGTTGAVAERFGRRWIMTDLGRFAIHTARKRLLGVEGCKPFLVQNLGKYERQYWQGVTFQKRSDEQAPIYEYIQFILKLYNAEPISGMLHIHGKKGKRLVHIGAVDAPVTLSEIMEAIEEVKKVGQDALDVLGWEWEMGLHDVVEKQAKASGIQLRLFNIPRDVMDPRAVEKGDVTFYELAYLEVEVKKNTSDKFVVELKDFAIPNLDLIPQEVRDKIKKWSDYIDYWAVDWDYKEDTFHNMWQSYRTRKERKLELKSDGHKYASGGKHIVMVKIIDIFGNDTTKILEVNA